MSFSKKRLWTNTYWYLTFILMQLSVELNSEQNGMIVKLKSNNNEVICQKMIFPGFFFANISSKILWHISKDAEFCGEFSSIFEISAKSLLKISHRVFVFLTGAGWRDVNLINFVPTGKRYLKNAKGSFVGQKIAYRMASTRSLQSIGKCPKKRKTFWIVYYLPLVI